MKIFFTLFIILFSAPLAAQTFPSLSKPVKVGGGEKDAALIIAIENYAFLPDIKGAEKNGNDWYRQLIEGFGLEANRVTFLKDKEASKEEILDSLQKLVAQKQEGGKLWFIFIGHGSPNAQGAGEGVLIGVDAQQNAKSILARGISQNEILEPLEKSGTTPDDLPLVLLDACFSGKSSAGKTLVPGLQPLVLVPEIKKSLIFLSAARNDEFAGPLPDNSRPAYSYLALGALRGWADKNADKNISIKELTNYVNYTFKTIIKGRTQTAGEFAPSTDLVLSKGVSEKGPDWVGFMTTENNATTISKPYVPKKKEEKKRSSLNLSFKTLSVPHFSMENVTIKGLSTENALVDKKSKMEEHEITLDVENQNETVLGLELELLSGDRGFVFGASAGFLKNPSDFVVTIRQSSGESTFNNLSPSKAKLTNIMIMEFGVSIGYHLRISDFSIYPQMGPGLSVMPTSLSFTLDDNDHSLSTTQFSPALLNSLNVSYDLFESVHLNASGHFDFPVGFGLKFGVGYYF